jgi:isopenicillin-N epimerase
MKTLPPYSDYAKLWRLDPSMVFLNHGSFGATPLAILEKQQQLRMQMESEPVRFMVRELYDLYQKSIHRLANFVGANEGDLVFVKNATMGVNTILHSLSFEAGDEILIHNHAYGACVNTIRWYAERHRLKVNCAEIPFPISEPGEITHAFLKALTPRTKLVLVDHITSPTGIIFPVKEITNALHSKQIEVLIDGAHAPGQVALDLDELGADYYTGNCHKWICSPKGSAFLYVRKDRQAKISPLQISHRFDAPVADEKKWQGNFFWPGTDDFTAYCCVGDAIDYFEEVVPGGWKKIMQMNSDSAKASRKILAEKLNAALPAPDEMIGNLATIPIGKGTPPAYGFNYINELQEELFTKYHIEVPIITFGNSTPQRYVRIAFQLYNDLKQVDYLAAALKELIQN